MSKAKHLALIPMFVLASCTSNPQQNSVTSAQQVSDCVFPFTSDPAPAWVCGVTPEEGEYENYKLLGMGTSEYTDGVHLNFMRKEARKAALEEIASSITAKVTSSIEGGNTRTTSGTFDGALSSAGKYLSDPSSFPGAIRVKEITSPDKKLYMLVGLRKKDLIAAAQGAANAVRSSLGNDAATYQVFTAERLLEAMEEDAETARKSQ